MITAAGLLTFQSIFILNFMQDLWIWRIFFKTHAPILRWKIDDFEKTYACEDVWYARVDVR